MSEAPRMKMESPRPVDPAAMIAVARNRIQEAIALHKPVATFALFSGGHDSLTASYIANLIPAVTATVHINTGIGVPETRIFVRETCAERAWRLLELHARFNRRANGTDDPQCYDVIVKRYGFPGPHGHNLMYARLKQRQIQALCRMYKKKRGDKILLIAGCRSEESVRRIRNTKPLSSEKGTCRIWVNPIHDFTKFDCSAIIAHGGLRRSPVVDLIHKSGECLCGAFAKPGELAELAVWFPAVAAEIRALEAEVKPVHGWGWEGQPPSKRCRLRMTKGQLDMPLCNSCLQSDAPPEK